MVEEEIEYEGLSPNAGLGVSVDDYSCCGILICMVVD